MIVNMDIDPRPFGNRCKGPNAGGLANVYKDQAGNLIEVDITDTLEAESVLGAFQEEFAQSCPPGKTMTASG
jgi:hypothetical protein